MEPKLPLGGYSRRFNPGGTRIHSVPAHRRQTARAGAPGAARDPKFARLGGTEASRGLGGPRPAARENERAGATDGARCLPNTQSLRVEPPGSTIRLQYATDAT